MDKIPGDFIDDEELDNVMNDVLKDEKPVASSRKRPRSSLSKSPFEVVVTAYGNNGLCIETLLFPIYVLKSHQGPAEMKIRAR